MKPGEIQILDDPAQLAAAREAYAKQHENRFTHLLKNPGEVRPWNDEDLELLRASRERSVASLAALRDDNSKPAALRVEAMVALDLLGVAPDCQQLVDLGVKNDEAAKALLLAISNSDRQELSGPLKAFLVRCIRSDDSHLRSLAASRVGYREVKEASDALSQVIRIQMPQPELCLLEAAAHINPSREILKLLRDQLFSDIPEWEKEGRLRAIAFLGDATSDADLRMETAQTCLDYLRGCPDTSSISGHVSQAVEFVARITPAESAKAMLRQLVLSSSWRLLQEDALDELEKLDATLAAETRAQAAIAERRPRGSKKKSPESERLTAEVAEVLVRTGVLTRSEVDRAIAKAKGSEDGEATEELPPVAFFAFADKLAIVHVKGDTHPARHDLLLKQFAKASGGLFNPEVPLERYESNLPDEPTNSDGGPGRWVRVGTGNYEVQFIHGERLYYIAPKDQGRWIDIVVVLDAIHKALEDAGVNERFIPHADSGEMGLFMFAKPAALKNASRELDLPLKEGFA